MSFTIGNKYKITIFGTSHGKEIGVVIDTPPAGFKIDMEKLREFVKKRAPYSNPLGTSRKEKDDFEIVSGIYNSYTNGSPLTAIIENKDVKKEDYENLEYTFRPSHADYTAYIKYKGFHDKTGGGHFSARLTAPIVIAGGIALQYLERENIQIYSHIKQIQDIKDELLENTAKNELEKIEQKELAFIKDENIEKTKKLIEKLQEEKNSSGGIIETGIYNLKKGLGNPIFDTIEGKLANMMFSIPAVKGIEFGKGFEVANLTGAEHNDRFEIKNGQITTTTNNSSGINGGITNGEPIIFSLAIKPTPSIGIEQQSVDIKTMENKKIIITGRHDPIIALRAAPVIKAATAITIMDLLTEDKWI